MIKAELNWEHSFLGAELIAATGNIDNYELQVALLEQGKKLLENLHQKCNYRIDTPETKSDMIDELPS